MKIIILLILSFALVFSVIYCYPSDNTDMAEFNAEMNRLRKEIEHVGRLRQLYAIYEYVQNSPYGVSTNEYY